MKLASLVEGSWFISPEDGVEVREAVYGQPIAQVSSTGIDFAAAVQYARRVGGSNLQRYTFHERAFMLRALANYLMERKEAFYQLSFRTGATRRDSWVDIEGGIATLYSYSSLARRELPDERFLLEEDPISLAREGGFMGRHFLTPKRGVAVHINAFNFPVWGMLEKLSPGLIAGVPAIVKPATQTAYLTEAVVKAIHQSGLLPEGAIQLICGATGDLLDQLDEQDMVTFTGSASTGRKLRTHPNLVAHSVPFNMEADSLNCTILGQTVQPQDPEFDLFVREVAREITSKAGQKCTAIRRVIVPRGMVEAVSQALASRLSRITLGDPGREDVFMGPLVGVAQRSEVQAVVAQLRRSTEVLWHDQTPQLLGGSWEQGGFMAPILLYADQPLVAREPHELEAFGPVATLLPYQDLEEAAQLARMGRGSLAGSIVTHDRQEARQLFFDCASTHGRILILNRENGSQSTGHGSPLPQLIHGGPGRAGGGEEMGGIRGVKHFMQRTAVQTDPTTLSVLSREYVRGAATHTDRIHPFRKRFEELQIGESLLTHRRTVTEADIVHFAALSGDHFYAHTDELAAANSLFGRRVAHGYFLVSAAAGLFVDPGVGPVLANYGLEKLRFIEPVGIGDTIQVRLTVARKTRKEARSDERATGVVAWDVEITNQDGKAVALYTILTLVERDE